MDFSRRKFLTAALGALGTGLFRGIPGTAFGSTSIGTAAAPYRIPSKAKKFIYLFQMGAPSQPDLWDWKPELVKRAGQDLPESVRKGLRFTSMSRGYARYPLLPSLAKFAPRGKSGQWVSDLLPNLANIADDLCFIKTLWCEDTILNHVPATNFALTGSRLGERPSIGAWLAYGLGVKNANLPPFCVMISKGSGRPIDLPAFNTYFGNGFLPAEFQGCKFLPGMPIPYLESPAGTDRQSRRQLLNDLADLNKLTLARTADPETEARTKQYELAYQMQASIPDVMDLSKEPESTFKLYGEDARRPGSYARNCIIARRLMERDVTCVQLIHMGWDQHQRITKELPMQCHDIDQASAALVTDLKQRGMLDETLVAWGGEFGRGVYIQGSVDDLKTKQFGRDHHPRCGTVWMAGGGVKAGYTHGVTDDFGFNVVKDPVHRHDFNATLLHLMGIDHLKLTFRYQGRDFRLTDLFGKVVHEIVA